MPWSPILNKEDGLSVRDKINALGSSVQNKLNVNSAGILFLLENADMQSLEDQIFEKKADFSRFILTQVLGFDADVTPTNAQGSMYSGAGKTGTSLFSATQSWGAVVAPERIVFLPVIQTALKSYTSDTFYLSLSQAAAAPSTCSIAIIGYILE